MIMATVALAAVLAMPATVPDILIAPIQVGDKVNDGSSLYIGKHYVAKHILAKQHDELFYNTLSLFLKAKATQALIRSQGT